jgi:hypothetical protein
MSSNSLTYPSTKLHSRSRSPPQSRGRSRSRSRSRSDKSNPPATAVEPRVATSPTAVTADNDGDKADNPTATVEPQPLVENGLSDDVLEFLCTMGHQIVQDFPPGERMSEYILDTLCVDSDTFEEFGKIDNEKFETFLKEAPVPIVKGVYQFMEEREIFNIQQVIQDWEYTEADMQNDEQKMFFRKFRDGVWCIDELLEHGINVA